jgi:hypothetical protein
MDAGANPVNVRDGLGGNPAEDLFSASNDWRHRAGWRESSPDTFTWGSRQKKAPDPVRGLNLLVEFIRVQFCDAPESELEPDLW